MTSGEVDVRRLAHRVLMPGFDGLTAPGWLKSAIAEGLGSACVFGDNVEDSAQLRTLTDELHACGPVVLSVDEEGGIVSRLASSMSRPGSRHVGAAALGVADDPELTRAVAWAIGADLRDAGLDLNLAPVADVTSNPDNPVIGVRAFGTDPAKVGAHVAAYVHGLRDAGILGCAKHFPGHGDTSVDSHLTLPRIAIDLRTLRERDLPPFVSAIAAGVEVIMTAHIVFEALDERPATLSALVLRMLREELGFTGVIHSDAMDMRAMVDTVGLAEGVVQALIAGVDLVGLGNAVLNAGPRSPEQIFTETLTAVIDAVTNGRLPLSRLQDAAARVDRLAEQASAQRTTLPDLQQGRAKEKHRANPDGAAAAAAICTDGHVRGALVGGVRIVDIRRRRNMAAADDGSPIAQAIAARHPDSTLHGPSDVPREADVVITGTPWLDDLEASTLRTLLDANPEAIVICTGWAPDLAALAPARRSIRTFGEDVPTAQAVVELLT